MKINHEREGDCKNFESYPRMNSHHSFSLDKTQTKLTQHPNAAVKEYPLSFELSQVHFVASMLQLIFTKVYQDC